MLCVGMHIPVWVTTQERGNQGETKPCLCREEEMYALNNPVHFNYELLHGHTDT